jgi:hypothetical protein
LWHVEYQVDDAIELHTHVNILECFQSIVFLKIMITINVFQESNVSLKNRGFKNNVDSLLISIVKIDIRINNIQLHNNRL